VVRLAVSRFSGCFEDDARLPAVGRLGTSILCDAKNQGLEKLEAGGKPYYRVARSGGKSVYTNHPLNADTRK